jgi:hypothetical protein
MARGWESKAIESQQQDAREVTSARRALTPEERDLVARRTSLELAMASTQAELLAACRAAHRDMLRLRLDAIHAELTPLRSGGNA